VQHLSAGLLADELDLAAGNAIWFAFLDEAYGRAAVQFTVRELAGGLPVAAALNRGVQQATGDSLSDAFREFHLWSLLVGPRSDRRHFSFAAGISPPPFASTADGLPALSIQSDPAVAPLGATQVQLNPEDGSEGLRVRFEGEFSGGWEADLVLLREDGTKHRLPLTISDGKGETTVPLQGVASAWLLIRNLEALEGSPRRYVYAAHREKGYPYELASLEASASDKPGSGIHISWETAAERGLVGFNILRKREEGGLNMVVNPVWIPALGGLDMPTVYHFVDRSAEPDVTYIYRIQAITPDGLTTLSEPVPIHKP